MWLILEWYVALLRQTQMSFCFSQNVCSSGFIRAAHMVDFAAELESCGSPPSASTLVCSVSSVSVSRGTTAARSTRPPLDH